MSDTTDTTQETRVYLGECERCGIAGLFVAKPGAPLVCEEGCGA